MLAKTKLQPNEQLVHIRSDSIEVTALSNTGVSRKKLISHDSFLEILTSSRKKIQLASHSMKDYHLGSNVIKFRHNDDGIIYYYLVRSGLYSFNNAGKRTKIHYPNLLFKISVTKDSELVGTNIFCIKEKDIVIKSTFGVPSFTVSNDTQLFAYPFGNVAENGNVCWGGNTFPLLDNYNALAELIGTFMDSPTNIDYTTGVFNNKESRATILNDLKTIEFDEDMLQPAKNNTQIKTFGEI